MNIQFNSLSSSLMTGMTLYRNQNGVGSKLSAQAGYALVSVIAAIETVASLIFSTVGLFAYPFQPHIFESSAPWLKSSAFCVIWSLADCILNPLCVRLIADEQSAHEVLNSGRLMRIPRGALY